MELVFAPFNLILDEISWNGPNSLLKDYDKGITPNRLGDQKRVIA
jgi:hypothetical protein